VSYYARKGKDSDVEVSFDGAFYVCEPCTISDGDGIRWFEHPGNMLGHLLEHQLAGHKVPPEVLRMLDTEAKCMPSSPGDEQSW
jgi:hypothetical protein